MAIVGTAHVIIRAITDQLEGDIKRSLDNAARNAGGSGDTAGQNFADSVNRHINNDVDAKGAAKNIENDIDAGGKRAGNAAEREIGDGVERGAKRGGKSAEDELGNAGGRAGNKFSKLFSSNGDGPSRVFVSMALRITALIPVLGALGGALSAAVSGLFAMGAAASQAVYGLAPLPGLLAAVVQGAGAVMLAFQGVGAALSAGLKQASRPIKDTGPSLQDLAMRARDAAAAVRAAAEAIRDAKEAVKDAEEGIRDAKETIRDAVTSLGDAVQAEADAEKQAAKMIEDAQQGVEDAKKQLAKVYADGAAAQAAALERVQTAENNLAKANARAQKAQENVTDARKKAQKRLIDLQFAERGGALAEQQAVMDLQDALYKMNATAELPPDNRIRQQAVLAYKEAQLNLELVQEKNGETSDELTDLRKTGVEGSDEVVAANEALVAAQEDVANATKETNAALADQAALAGQITDAINAANKALANAKEALKNAFKDAPKLIRDAKEAVRDAKESLRDAREALRDAIETLSDAHTGVADAIRGLADAKVNAADAAKAFSSGVKPLDLYAIAMAKLSPAAQDFVKFLIQIKDRFKELRDAAQTGLFPGLEDAITKLAYGPLFPILRKQLFDTGQAVASTANDLADSLNSGPFTSSFNKVATQNVWIIKQIGKVVGDLATAFIQFVDAARPVTRELVKWIVKWADSLRFTGGEQDKMRDKILKGAEVGKQLIRIIKNLWNGIRDLGTAATPAGQKLLNQFEKATKAFAKFGDTKKGREQLKTFFDDVGKNFHALSSLILVLGGSLARLGQDKSIGKLSKQLEPVVLHLEDLVKAMTGKLGPQLVILIDQIILAFAQVSKSHGLETFINIMIGAVKGLTLAFKTPVLGQGLKILVQLGAAMYALSIIKKFPGISQLYKSTTWLFKKDAKNPAALTGIEKIKNGLSKAGDAAKSAGNKISSFGNTIAKGIGTGISSTKKFVVEQSKLIAQQIKLAAIWVKDAALRAASTAATYAQIIASKIASAATKIWTGIQIAFNFVMSANPIVLVAIAIAALVAGVIIAYNKFDWFHKLVDKIFHGIADAAQWLYDILFGHSIIPDIVKGFTDFFDAVSDIFTAIADFFTKTIPNAAQKLFNWLGNHWTTIVAILGGPLGIAIKLIHDHWDTIIGVFKSAKDWVVDKFAAAWSVVKEKIVKPLGDAVDKIGEFFGEGGSFRGFFSGIKDWIVDTWSSQWAKVKDNIIDPIKSAKDAIVAFFDFSGEGGPIKKAFVSAVAGIGSIWDGLKKLAAEPVNFVIDTVYNNGLRKALNLLPGVNLPEADPITYATGGILPGWSPGSDIHKFYSPTAGALNLSGGEAIMRPEFSRAMGGEEGIRRLNKMARQGKLTPRSFNEQSHADGGIIYIDGEKMTQVAAKQLALAEKLSGMNMTVIQGSYQPYTTYSGSSHAGGGVMDTGPGSFLAQSWLRKVGFAAWARNIPGAAYAGSGAHVHSVSLVDPTAAGNSQASAYWRGEDGLGGSDYGPRPAILANLSSLLGGVDVHGGGGSPGEDEHQSWLSKIKAIVSIVPEIAKNVFSMPDKFAWDVFSDAARSVGHDMVQHINDVIPDSIEIPGPNIPLPDNPIPNPFDSGGVATGANAWIPKRTASPERVLSPDQTTAFERLVSVLERDGGAGSGGIGHLTVNVPHDASARDVIEGIAYEVRRNNLKGRYS